MIYLFYSLFSLLMASEKPSVLVSLNPSLPPERVIYLSDVAEVRGLSQTQKKEVEKIVLGLTSIEYKKLTKIELIRTLRGELAPFEQEFDCEIQLVFSRANDSTTQNNFSLDSAYKELVSRLQTLCMDCIYQVSNLNILRGTVPKAFSKWTLQDNLKDVRGPSMVRVYFDNEYLNPMVLQGLVRVQQPVMVLKRPLVKGSVLTDADFKLETLDVTNEHKSFAIAKDLVGKELKRSLALAHVLTIEDIVDKQVVRIGEPVAIEIKNGSILLEMTGIAQKSGKVGDRIPIRVTKTQKQIMAEVIADSRVRFE